MTTADPVTYLETNRCRPDTVPSRVAYHHPLTEYEKQQAEAAAELEASMSPRRRFDLPPMPELLPDGTAVVEPESRSWFAEHAPSDVVYWVACFGGACLLLLCAIH
ncbi:MAG TPA: hypothetical protein VJU82_10950 [Acidobacteriaceae bacterium]|nr:hypothetical protein [Acidobacteriaceae bacterium]